MSRLKQQRFVNLLAALALTWMLSTPVRGEGEQTPSVAQLVADLPRLASADPEMENISFVLRAEGMTFLVAWQRGKSLQVLSWDMVDSAPFVLLAEDGLLINDPSKHCVWLGEVNAPCLELARGDDRFSFRFNPKPNAEMQEASGEGGKSLLTEPIRLDLPAISAGNYWAATFTTLSSGKSVLRFPCIRHNLTTTLTFDLNSRLTSFVKRYDKIPAGVRSAEVFRIENIACNVEQPLTFLFPVTNAVTNNIKTLPLQTGKQHEIEVLTILKAAVHARGGLMFPKHRHTFDMPRHFDWQTAEEYDREVSPRLWEMILAAQPEHVREFLKEDRAEDHLPTDVRE